MALPVVFFLALLPLVMVIVLGLIFGVCLVAAICHLVEWLRRPSQAAQG